MNNRNMSISRSLLNDLNLEIFVWQNNGTMMRLLYYDCLLNFFLQEELTGNWIAWTNTKPIVKRDSASVSDLFSGEELRGK